MKGFKETEYEFWIDAYSPKTIPMKRLGEYMAELGRLLGNDSSIHFRELIGGSTAVRYAVEPEAVNKVEDRLAAINHAEAANDTMFVRKKIDEMLRDDGAIGEIRRMQGGAHHAVKIRFAGREITKPQKVGPFNEPASFKGELVRLGGEDATKHAGIRDSQGRTWPGDMNRELAIEMRQYLFEMVMVSGDARWMRNEQGEWELKAFHISSCKPLPKDSLEDDIKALRDVPDNQWKELSDPQGFIRESRKDDDEIH